MAVVATILAVCTLGAAVEPSLARTQAALRAAADPHGARGSLLGDSQMLTLAFYGSAAFTASGPQFELAAIVGCGVFDPGVQTQGACATRAATWRARIRTFDPDLSVLLVGAWETLDFTSGGHTYIHGTPQHERALEAVITDALHALTARGGRVALLEVPCFGNPDPADAAGRQRTAPGSVANVNDALRHVAERDAPQVAFVPWASAVCPGGRFEPKVDGIDVRPDGVHFASVAASELATDRIVPAVRDLAISAHAARIAAAGPRTREDRTGAGP